MAISINLWQKASTMLDGIERKAGGLDKAKTISATNEEYYSKVISIADAANTAIYADELGSFQFLWIQTDYNSRLYLTDTNSDTMSLGILGTGTSEDYGPAFTLCEDATTSGFRINAARIINASGSTLKCFILAFD